MKENVKSYHQNKALIDNEGWKQIAIYSLTEFVLLIGLVFVGPLFVPENFDDVDGIIGLDWSAKYYD